MKKIEMTDLAARHLVVPGGWHAHVPAVTPDEEWLAHVTRYFIADGYQPAQARALALAVAQAKSDAGWVRDIRQSIRRYALIYARRFGSLDGFDPEMMQAAYMPGVAENTGRRGKQFVNSLFMEMRKELSNA
jgi:hypothetical protein